MAIFHESDDIPDIKDINMTSVKFTENRVCLNIKEVEESLSIDSQNQLIATPSVDNLERGSSRSSISRSNEKRVEFVLDKYNKKIEDLQNAMQKIEVKKSAILTDYLQKIEKTTLSESQILESALYKNYNEKNLKYKQDLERAAKKLKSYEAKRDEIASSGKVSPSNYIKDLSFQKLTDGANDFRNKMNKLIYREESSGAGGQKDEQPKVDLNNDENKRSTFENLKCQIDTLFNTNSSDSDKSKNLTPTREKMNSNDTLDKMKNKNNSLDLAQNNIVMGKTFKMITDIVENMDTRVKTIDEQLIHMDEIESKIESRIEDYDKNIEVKLNLPITECYKQAEIVAEINIAVDSIDKRLSKVENLITNLAVKDNNQELSPAQLVLTKLANVLVQIISIIVMLVSSFADVIIGLDKNLKLFIIISFLLYMLLGLLKPALTIFF